MKAKKYNKYLITNLIIFFIISILSIWSANSIGSVATDNVILKQIIFYIIGIIVLLLSFYFKDLIIKNSLIIYITLNIALLLLLILGISVNGSKCWFFIGPFSFQPSEFMKIFLIIEISTIMCKYDNQREKKEMKNEFTLLCKILIITLIPAILTFLEPDTGVVIIYFIIMITIVLYKGINRKWYIYLAILVIAISSSITILYLLKKEFLINLLGNNFFYRFDRIFNWTNQNGYQLENSLIAIGASGIIGFGFNNVPIYFPEASTDFIFATFSSNYGFLGSVFLITITTLFDITLLDLCREKIKKEDKYIVIGLTGMIFYQQIQNICMTIGLLPITGITLPFISYGGSSLLSYMLILGLIINIITKQAKYLNE